MLSWLPYIVCYLGCHQPYSEAISCQFTVLIVAYHRQLIFIPPLITVCGWHHTVLLCILMLLCNLFCSCRKLSMIVTTDKSISTSGESLNRKYKHTLPVVNHVISVVTISLTCPTSSNGLYHAPVYWRIHTMQQCQSVTLST